MTDRPPYMMLFDLGNLPEKGAELVLKPRPAELVQIAAWLEIESLERLEASVKLSHGSSGRYFYRAHFDADVVQTCVVTLEPVHSHISEDFDRSFMLAAPLAKHGRRSGKGTASEVVLLPDAEDDTPETLDSPVLDLAAPLLEELSSFARPLSTQTGCFFCAAGGHCGRDCRQSILGSAKAEGLVKRPFRRPLRLDPVSATSARLFCGCTQAASAIQERFRHGGSKTKNLAVEAQYAPFAPRAFSRSPRGMFELRRIETAASRLSGMRSL